MHHGAKITGKVRSDKRKRSPLTNGGLEKIIDIEVDWEDKEKLAILTKQVEQVNYPLYSDYCDDSKEYKVVGIEKINIFTKHFKDLNYTLSSSKFHQLSFCEISFL